jgi:hypothetical protein
MEIWSITAQFTKPCSRGVRNGYGEMKTNVSISCELLESAPVQTSFELFRLWSRRRHYARTDKPGTGDDGQLCP